MDAMIDNLLHVQGMSHARHVLYGGCSAGGLTAYLHTDYVASRMPSTTKALAMADAMFSLNSNSYAGVNLFPHRMEWGFSAWKAAASVNQDCLKFYGEANGFQCMFGGNAAHFVKTPLFVLNSKYDTWQEKAVIGTNATIACCPVKVKAFWVNYGQEMVTKIDSLPPQHGAVLTNCPGHCQTGTYGNVPWLETVINRTAMGEAFNWWRHHTLGEPAPVGNRWVECCNVEPCAPDKCA